VKGHSRLYKDVHDLVVKNGDWRALLALVALCRARSDAAHGDKEFFQAGAARLAGSVGTSKSTIRRGVRTLQKIGVVEVRSGRRSDRSGDHELNAYRLIQGTPEDAEGYTPIDHTGMVPQDNGYAPIGDRLKHPLKGGKEKKAPRSARSGSKAVAAGEGSEETEPAFIAWK
jgi:hypothetical protein